MTTVISYVAHLMGPVMGLWVSAGLIILFVDLNKLLGDESRLTEAKRRLAEARGTDYPTKVRIRAEIVDWADSLPSCGLRRWIYTIHNTVLAGGQADASALTDAIWSQERERHFAFRFFARTAIMLGLFFTSAGLCLTLADVAPALTAKSANVQEWMAGIQATLGTALGGMSQAFYSSLAGILVSLTLNGVAAIFLVPRHERYLADVDGFVQGTLIPVFAAIVEHDRNDVIRESMDRAHDMFSGVKKQYEMVLAGFQGYEQDSRAMRDVLAQGIDLLRQQIGTFADKTAALDNAAEKIQAAGEGIVGVIGLQTTALQQASDQQAQMLDRMDQLVEVLSLGGESIQAQLAKTYELHKEAVSELYDTLGSSLRLSLADVAKSAGDEMATHLGAGVQQALNDTHDRLTGLDEVLKAVAARQTETNEAINELQRGLGYNADALRAELDQRRTFAEAVSQEAVTAMAGQLRQDVITQVEGLSARFAETLDASLQRQEQIVRDLNQAVGVKWEHLLTAYMAGTGTQAGASR